MIPEKAQSQSPSQEMLEKLKAAIRAHKAQHRPSAWSQADRELYRSLAEIDQTQPAHLPVEVPEGMIHRPDEGLTDLLRLASDHFDAAY